MYAKCIVIGISHMKENEDNYVQLVCKELLAERERLKNNPMLLGWHSRAANFQEMARVRL